MLGLGLNCAVFLSSLVTHVFYFLHVIFVLHSSLIMVSIVQERERERERERATLHQRPCVDWISEGGWFYKRVWSASLIEGVLLAFIAWLGTVNGKNRTPKQATEIAVDVSKFLHFCSQEAVHQIHFSYTPAEFNRYLTTQTVKLTWPSYSLAHT